MVGVERTVTGFERRLSISSVLATGRRLCRVRIENCETVQDAVFASVVDPSAVGCSKRRCLIVKTSFAFDVLLQDDNENRAGAGRGMLRLARFDIVFYV